MTSEDSKIMNEYAAFIRDKSFVCIGAKTALTKNQAHCMVAGNMACPADDAAIMNYLYSFTDKYRITGGQFHSAAIIFKSPQIKSEAIFERLMWQRLQSIYNLDTIRFAYDKRVSANPASPHFSFSIKEEAFFILGMHPASSRPSRRFAYPALIFNPHEQFEQMKKTNKYEMIKQSVRKRDIILSGSINPMLSDHGKASEAIQYSGKNYTGIFECPLKTKHADK